MYVWKVWFLCPDAPDYLTVLRGINVHKVDQLRWRSGENERRNPHPQLRFRYTLEGEGLFYDGQRMIELPKGVGVLYHVHEEDYHFELANRRNHSYTFLTISMEGLHTQQLCKNIIYSHGRRFDLPETHSTLLRLQKYKRIWDDFQASDPSDSHHTPRGTLSLFEAMQSAADLISSLVTLNKKTTHELPQYALAMKARDLINANLKSPLTVSELAENLDVSREHLSRVFKAHLEQSPYQYIQQMRANHAAEIIKDTELSMKEIAHLMGYADSSHFTRSFREQMGMTPGEFRQLGYFVEDK